MYLLLKLLHVLAAFGLVRTARPVEALLIASIVVLMVLKP